MGALLQWVELAVLHGHDDALILGAAIGIERELAATENDGKSFIFASASRIDSCAGVAHQVIEGRIPIGGMIVKITVALTIRISGGPTSTSARLKK